MYERLLGTVTARPEYADSLVNLAWISSAAGGVDDALALSRRALQESRDLKDSDAKLHTPALVRAMITYVHTHELHQVELPEARAVLAEAAGSATTYARCDPKTSPPR